MGLGSWEFEEMSTDRLELGRCGHEVGKLWAQVGMTSSGLHDLALYLEFAVSSMLKLALMRFPDALLRS